MKRKKKMKTTGDVIAEIRQSKGMGVFEKETAAIAAFEQSAPFNRGGQKGGRGRQKNRTSRSKRKSS